MSDLNKPVKPKSLIFSLKLRSPWLSSKTFTRLKDRDLINAHKRIRSNMRLTRKPKWKSTSREFATSVVKEKMISK